MNNLFEEFVSTVHTIAAANDLELPSPSSIFEAALTAAIRASETTPGLSPITVDQVSQKQLCVFVTPTQAEKFRLECLALDKTKLEAGRVTITQQDTNPHPVQELKPLPERPLI